MLHLVLYILCDGKVKTNENEICKQFQTTYIIVCCNNVFSLVMVINVLSMFSTFAFC